MVSPRRCLQPEYDDREKHKPVLVGHFNPHLIAEPNEFWTIPDYLGSLNDRVNASRLMVGQLLTQIVWIVDRSSQVEEEPHRPATADAAISFDRRSDAATKLLIAVLGLICLIPLPVHTRRGETRLIEKLLLKLRRFDTVSAAEEQALRAAASGEVKFARGATLVKAKTDLGNSNLLLDGFVYRYKDLKNGSRQILELSVPGDFIDLHSLLLKQLDHHIAAFTDGSLALFPHDRLKEVIADHQHLGRLLWLSTLVDAAIHRELMVSLGRRDAYGRLAHLFCELQVRLTAAGMAEHGTYELPLTQVDLAEMLGLTSVHINRVLKQLRQEGIVTFRNKTVEIQDWDRLVSAAEFDPFYLNLTQRPR